MAVVTNQAGVARGYYGIEDVHQVHKHMIEEMARHGAHVDLWLFCPYHPDGIVESFARASADRKPGPGMALAAAEALGLDLTVVLGRGRQRGRHGAGSGCGRTALHVGPVAFPAATSCPSPTWPQPCGTSSTTPTGRCRGRGRRSRHAAYPDGGSLRHRLRARSSARAFGLGRHGPVAEAAELLNDAYDRDATVFACGNGGSASIANHLQCDHVKGVRNGTDLTTRVFSLSTNIELFSAIANDHGYDTVFEYQLQSLARPGDVL